MKRILIVIAIALGILMFTAPDAWARGGIQGDIASCRGVDCARVSTFSPVTWETVSGEVIDVYRATSRQGYKSGLHLLVKANEETIDVHLGPISYIEGQNFNFEPGDALEIKGDRFTDSPMPTMTAIEVKKGNDILTLRDNDGFPMWRDSLRQ